MAILRFSVNPLTDAIESVENTRLSVDEHPAASFEIRKAGLAAGVELEFQTPGAVGRIHEAAKVSFRGINLQDTVRESEHDVLSSTIFVEEAAAMRVQQPRTLEVPSLLFKEDQG